VIVKIMSIAAKRIEGVLQHDWSQTIE
jgi:hypothetical protein